MKQEVLNYKRVMLPKDRENARLQMQLDTAKHTALCKKKQSEFFEKQANQKKKPVISVKDQIKIENTRRENQIKIAEERKMAKVVAGEKKKDNDLKR